jgi:hypothetical protein|tara:strand:- start:231 stop:611 length:381 start_codon:yes stop_codon:yes gene_type:complete
MGYIPGRNELGVMGSVFADSANGRITPPTGKVFIAITFVNDTVLETLGVNAGGLTGDTSDADYEHIGTDVAAHNVSVGSETAISGGGGVIVDASNSFKAGTTIYGRWTSVEVANGANGVLIAYIGK